MAYRKSKTSDTWHFCSNCTKRPTTNYVEQVAKPSSGEFCNECMAKRKENNCKA